MNKFLLFFILVFSNTIFALSIGDLMVFSSDTEPFYAEVNLVNLSSEEAAKSAIKADVVKDKAVYDKVKTPYMDYLSSFTVEFRMIDSSQAVVILKNTASIPEKELAVILTISSPTGSKFKKYNTFEGVPPATQAATKPEPVVATTEVSQVSQEIAKSGGLKIDIAENDSLENIGKSIYLAYYRGNNDVNIEQIMTAIRRDSADAFENADSYKLIAGRSIYLPSYSQITIQSRSDAKAEIDYYYRQYFKEKSFKGTGKKSKAKAKAEYDTNIPDAYTLRLLTEDQQRYKRMIGLKQDQIAVLERKSKFLADKIRESDKQITGFANLISLKNRDLLAMKGDLRRQASLTARTAAYLMWLDARSLFFDNVGVLLFAALAAMLVWAYFRRTTYVIRDGHPVNVPSRMPPVKHHMMPHQAMQPMVPMVPQMPQMVPMVPQMQPIPQMVPMVPQMQPMMPYTSTVMPPYHQYPHQPYPSTTTDNPINPKKLYIAKALLGVGSIGEAKSILKQVVNGSNSKDALEAEQILRNL